MNIKRKHSSIILNSLFLVVMLIVFLSSISFFLIKTDQKEAIYTLEVADTLTSSKPVINVPKSRAIEYEAEYIMLNREQMMQEADIIVYGTVQKISKTQWNQDNGNYWEVRTEEENGETFHAATPVHTIELSVIAAPRDLIGIGNNVTITESGISPLDRERSIKVRDDLMLIGDTSYDLQVGDEIVIFLVQTEIAWYDSSQKVELKKSDDESITYFDVGSREIIGFIGAPSTSYFLKKTDGLFHNHPSSSFQIPPFSLERLIADS